MIAQKEKRMYTEKGERRKKKKERRKRRGRKKKEGKGISLEDCVYECSCSCWFSKGDGNKKKRSYRKKRKTGWRMFSALEDRIDRPSCG
jgi:hypothetical protein